jgi:hypothetical protein
MSADEMRRFVKLLETANNYLMENDFTPFNGAVKFTDWTLFIDAIKQAVTHGFTTEEELCGYVGLEYPRYQRVVQTAINNWRDSTSTSLLHGIAHINLEQPRAGQQVFPDVMWQTRFIAMLVREKLIGKFHIQFIKNSDQTDKPFLMVRGEHALTTEDKILTQFLQILYLYNFYNHHKQTTTKVKLPSFIYRGVRAHDLWQHANLKDIVGEIWKRDQSREMNRRDVINALCDYIIKNGLNKIAEGRIFSFTASIPVAKYFSNGEGFILRVDPRKVHILTSEVHDPERIGGKDYVSNKNEREYIIRIPDDYRFTNDDIIINDQEYFIAEHNPLCVALFDHNDKEATYTLNGVDITAKFNWNSSGTKGSLSFNWDSRVQFKQYHGFDPLPTEGNLDQISNFQIHRVKAW